MRRGKKLLSFAASLLLLASLLVPLIPPVSVSATDGPPGDDRFVPISITTCQELQNMDNNVKGIYVLNNNLDCSGLGFTPIGFFGTGDGGYDNFRGSFYGQGHTISNLGAPLFALLDSGIIANVSFSGSMSVDSSERMGFLAMSSYYGLISDVHATGAITLDTPQSSVGGLFGYTNGSTIIRSSAVIDIQVETTQVEFGGLASGASDTTIQDSYAVPTVNVVSGGVEHGGGLTVGGGGNKIIRSYAGGSINNNNEVHEIGGLVWFGTETTVVNSFSTFQGAGLCNGTNGCSGLVTIADEGLDLSTDYFDQTAVGSNLCNGDGSNTTCNRVNTDGSQPNYFKNNTTNGPFGSWDFSDVWMTTAGLPTLRAFSDPSPQPDPVGQLTATIGSSSAINLDWILPSSTGSAPMLAEEVYYQEVGGTEWFKVQATDIQSYSDASANFNGISLTVGNLLPSTSYNLEVIAYNQDGYYSSSTVSGVTGTPGLRLISNCEQLQDIGNNLVDNFELARNIDCSDSVNWNGGSGFIPIGCDPDTGSTSAFTGVFAGNNYTISNIHVDGGNDCYDKAIFLASWGALIQDFTIDNPTIQGSKYNNYGNAVLAAVDSGSTFSNIHIRFTATGDDQLISAGVIGNTYGDVATTMNRVSVIGSMSGDMGLVGGFGGLVFSPQAPVVVNDSYVQVNITDVTADTESYVGYIGGFFGYNENQVQITNSYAALSYDGTASVPFENYSHLIGGLIGFTNTEPVISRSFARTDVQNYPGDPSVTGGLIGVLLDNDDDPDTAAPALDLGGNYFDADLIGTSQCAGSYIGDDSVYSRSATCNAISGQPNYFNNNSTNPPLDSWDFDNIWETTSTLPVFSRKVLSAITPIPASRLTPKKTPSSPNREIIPAQPVPTPAKVIAQLKDDRAQTVANSSSVAPQGILEQLKQLLSYIPAGVLVSFPYLLFGLLLIAALALLVEMMRQAKRLKQLNLLLAQQRSVAEKRDTFWHLAANYLRAPITLLMGGADLLALSKLDNTETRQLTTLSQHLQTKVADIMQQIEHSHTLQGIKSPRAEKPRRVWLSVGFWLPVVTVAVLIILTNYVAQSWRGLNLSAINLTSQALLFLLAALALYWTLSALGVVTGRRRKAERLLRQQEQALDAARLHLISQTATDLDTDVSRLQALLAKFSVASQAKPIMQEGASRLRHLVDSFQLLINAQNHRLSSLSPAGTHASLNRVLKESVAELEPEITAKNLTVDLPAKHDLQVLGSHGLNSQVLSSVLANAIAFSPSGSTIRLDIEHVDSGTCLTVADHGQGITAAQQAHLFEPFTKADGQTGLQLDHDGLGINLYLNRQIMDYLGGHITVHSAAGQGVVVELYWPHAVSRVTQPGMMVHPGTSAA